MGIRDYEFRGRTYDQWELGEEYITGARTITEADIVNFAGLSGDWSATHTNDVYGKGTIYGSRIAYGNVTFIVSTGLLTQTLMFEGTTVALLDMQISYQEPVRFEDTIYCKFIPVEKQNARPGSGHVPRVRLQPERRAGGRGTAGVSHFQRKRAHVTAAPPIT